MKRYKLWSEVRHKRDPPPAEFGCPRCGAGVRPAFGDDGKRLMEGATLMWECADFTCGHVFAAEGVPAPMCGTVMPEAEE